MLNYLKKFALEILPSVAATVIGAYIVNHYISAKPAADAPVAAAVSPAEVKKNAPKPADGVSNVASIPAHGITARGISERAMMEKSASERPGEFKPAETKSEAKPSEGKASEAKASEAKSSEAKAEAKPSESKSETASAPAKHATPAAPPKAVAKTTPAAPVEAASTPAEEHRDANDLARAAIERLRKEDSQSHTQEASRAPDAPRLQEAPRTVAAPPMATAAVRPLPPPITVIAPPVEGQGNNNQGNGPSNMASNPAPYTASINADNPNGLVPPADIPPPPPIDLRADASKLATRTNNVAQDVLAKTRSMFHALLPGSNGDGGDNRQSSSASQFTD